MKIALGSAQFGLDYGVANRTGAPEITEIHSILERASQAGIDTIDTAIAYGSSERVLGEVGVKNWRVITKLPQLPEDCTDVAGWVESEVEGSLQRLDIDQLHGLLLHRPAELYGSQGKQLSAALMQIQEKAMARKIGISVYAPDELENLGERIDIGIVQAPINILDRRMIDSGWAHKLHGAGVELHARSAYLQGLLLMSEADRPLWFNQWSEVWSEWHRWLETQHISPVDACMRFMMSLDEVDRVVVGVDSAAQLNEFLDLAIEPLTSLPDWPELKDSRLLNPAKWELQ